MKNMITFKQLKKEFLSDPKKRPLMTSLLQNLLPLKK